MAEMDACDGDMFDSLLELEEQFYQEGYRLGEIDGERAGHLEGRAFGIEKGFEKFREMGRLNGRALVWSGRLGETHMPSSEGNQVFQSSNDEITSHGLKPLASGKLESHLRTLYALTEPESLSTENNEEKVAEFDDRFRRAQGKVKIVEKLVRDRGLKTLSIDKPSSAHAKPQGQLESNIEDVSIMHARH